MSFEHLFYFELSKGSHTKAELGLCAMEAVAWLEGLSHSDRPECTCPIIASYVRCLNDYLPQNKRQALIPYLPRLVGTVSKKHEQKRAEFLAWQAIRVFAPAKLRASGFEAEAKTLERQNRNLTDAARAAYAAAEAVLAAAYVAADAADAADAVDAAETARAAAEAADVAADVAARAGARAARASARAARAACYSVWENAFDALEGVLAIGPQSPGFSKNTEQRVSAYRELVSTKEQ